MNEFIDMLNALFQSNETITETEDGENYIIGGENYYEVIGNADEYLIDGGFLNIVNTKRLREEGFRVYPGEKDSFGLLTACIEKDNKILVFG